MFELWRKYLWRVYPYFIEKVFGWYSAYYSDGDCRLIRYSRKREDCVEEIRQHKIMLDFQPPNHDS